MRILDKIEYVWKDEWFYKRLIRNTVIYPYIYIYVNKFHHIEISMYMYICTYVWFYILHGVEEHVRGICWFLIRCNCHREALQRKTEFLCGRMLWKNHDVIFVKESHWTKRTPIQIAKKTSAHNGIDINMNIYLYMGLFGVSWSTRSNSHMTSICCHKLHYYAFCSQQMRTNTQRFMFGKNETHVIRVVLL